MNNKIVVRCEEAMKDPEKVRQLYIAAMELYTDLVEVEDDRFEGEEYMGCAKLRRALIYFEGGPHPREETEDRYHYNVED